MRSSLRELVHWGWNALTVFAVLTILNPPPSDAFDLERWQGKVAVVTGASAGIGAALAENLVESGVTVVGFARRKQKLDEVGQRLAGKKGTFHSCVVDMTKEHDIVTAFKWIKENVGNVSILVNNAGISRITSLIDGNTELWKQVLDTNVMGLCIATREAIQSMKASGIDGHIVHINSVVGHKVVPTFLSNVYGPSKYAVTSLAETLRLELANMKKKIKVSSVSPGVVKTGFLEASEISSNVTFDQETKNLIAVQPGLNAQEVADAVTYVLSTPPNVQITELTIQATGEPF